MDRLPQDRLPQKTEHQIPKMPNKELPPVLFGTSSPERFPDPFPLTQVRSEAEETFHRREAGISLLSLFGRVPFTCTKCFA